VGRVQGLTDSVAAIRLVCDLRLVRRSVFEIKSALGVVSK